MSGPYSRGRYIIVRCRTLSEAWSLSHRVRLTKSQATSVGIEERGLTTLGGFTPRENSPFMDNGSCLLGCDCICPIGFSNARPPEACSTIIYTFGVSAVAQDLMTGHPVGGTPSHDSLDQLQIEIMAESR
jgi:hypothetical protein